MVIAAQYVHGDDDGIFFMEVPNNAEFPHTGFAVDTWACFITILKKTHNIVESQMS